MGGFWQFIVLMIRSGFCLFRWWFRYFGDFWFIALDVSVGLVCDERVVFGCYKAEIVVGSLFWVFLAKVILGFAGLILLLFLFGRLLKLVICISGKLV